MIDRINKISNKIQHIEERLKEDMPYKKKNQFKRQLCCKKSLLRKLCQLYIWGVK